MKKIINLFFLVYLFIFVSCKFEIPEKLSLKSEASYNFNIGNFNKDLSEIVDFNNLINSEAIKNAIPNAQVYNYFPGEIDSNIQKFLIKLPLVEIPIDIGNYFNNSDLSNAVQGISFEKEIKIPSIEIEKSTEIDLSYLNENINKVCVFNGETSEDGIVSFLLDFTEIEYSSITFEISAFETDSIADGTIVTISNGVTSGTGTFSGNKAEIIFNSKLKLTKTDTHICFNGDYGKKYQGKLKESSQITKAKGITCSSIDFSNSISTSVDIPNAFEVATVEEGTLKTSVNCSSWSGATISYGITTTGNITINETKSSSKIKNISLNGKTISAGQINVSVPFEIEFNNATIDFLSNPTITIAMNIESFSEITVETSEIQTSFNKEQAFPSEVTESICGMVLKSSGIKGTYTNTFPEGNEITLTVNSNFFSINNKSCTLGCNKRKKSFEIMSDEETKEITIVSTGHDPINNKFGKWDFSMSIDLPGAETDKITVKNVKPNQTYKMEIDLLPELNWDSVKVKVPSLNKSDKKSLGLNFAELFKSVSDIIGINDFGSKINVKSIPVYLHAEKPLGIDAFNSLSIDAYVSLFYSNNGNTPIIDTDGSIQTDLIGDSNAKKTLKFVNGIPEYRIRNNNLITNISNYPSSVNCNLADFINRTLAVEDGSLYINYEISLNETEEITVTKKDCENMGSGVVAVTAFIELPFQFKVISSVDSVDIDLTGIIKTALGGVGDVDLFGRSNATPIIPTEANEYTDIVKSCTLMYKTKDLPIYSNQVIDVKIKMTSSGEEKKLNIGGDKVIVQRSDINQIFSQDSYPYMPDLKVSIPPSTEFSIKRKMEFDIALSLIANTEGLISIYGGK